MTTGDLYTNGGRQVKLGARKNIGMGEGWEVLDPTTGKSDGWLPDGAFTNGSHAPAGTPEAATLEAQYARHIEMHAELGQNGTATLEPPAAAVEAVPEPEAPVLKAPRRRDR